MVEDEYDSNECDDIPFEVTGTIADMARESVEESEESAKGFLRESWRAHTMATLYRARWAANLTQAEVAESLGTTQSAIARLERAEDTSLRRFWDYLYVCGVSPLWVETVPFSELREYVRQQPGADRTARPVEKWRASKHPPKATPRRKRAARSKEPAFINEDKETYSAS
jgi:transcriptional regulator with XRE-family HTH domain